MVRRYKTGQTLAHAKIVLPAWFVEILHDGETGANPFVFRMTDGSEVVVEHIDNISESQFDSSMWIDCHIRYPGHETEVVRASLQTQNIMAVYEYVDYTKTQPE